MSQTTCAFFLGIWTGLIGTTIGIALMVRAAGLFGRIRPAPFDAREAQLERLRSVDSVLAIALRQVPAAGYRAVPRGTQ